MHFKKSDIKKVKSHVMERAETLNVMLGKADLERFNNTINNIRKSKQYYEGETIDQKHLNALKSNVNLAIDNLGKFLVQNIHKYKEYVDYANPVEYLVTAVDSLYISAMEELGCPHIPLFHFDKDIKQTLAQSAMAIHRNYVTYDISKADTFKQQRGKDAAEVSKEFKTLVDGIKNEKKAESVGKMIAEYQALKERQKNHNAFWRLFHRTENKDRNALIEKMGKHIRNQLPEGMKNINLDDAAPNSVSRNIADALIRGEIEVAGAKRYDSKTLTQVFGCSPSTEDIADQYKLFNEFSKKEQMSKDENFLNDIIGMDDAKTNHAFNEDAVKNDKVAVKEDNEFSLFN